MPERGHVPVVLLRAGETASHRVAPHWPPPPRPRRRPHPPSRPHPSPSGAPRRPQVHAVPAAGPAAPSSPGEARRVWWWGGRMRRSAAAAGPAARCTKGTAGDGTTRWFSTAATARPSIWWVRPWAGSESRAVGAARAGLRVSGRLGVCLLVAAGHPPGLPGCLTLPGPADDG